MAFLLGHAVCTGSVIGRQYILSAGHCVHAGNGKSIPAESLVVFVGSANLSQATPISVEKIILRSEYNDRIDDQIEEITFKLATPLNLSETLWPICLSRNSAAMAVTTVETKENILPTEECVDLETKWHMEEMAKRNATNFFPALYGMNPRELRRRVASKLTDKICVVSNKTVVESGDSGGPLLLSSAPGKWTQIGTLTGGPCHGKDAPMHGKK
uniref:Peptidase S1 domain-containing protein n=1 Tax=Meloidogyne javanica TaxID=6303 RepID=A0A915LE87_MELJA